MSPETIASPAVGLDSTLCLYMLDYSSVHWGMFLSIQPVGSACTAWSFFLDTALMKWLGGGWTLMCCPALGSFRSHGSRKWCVRCTWMGSLFPMDLDDHIVTYVIHVAYTFDEYISCTAKVRLLPLWTALFHEIILMWLTSKWIT
jgi:hypothetical protein